jgi:imidazolonepropionase-like amidohydrolase
LEALGRVVEGKVPAIFTAEREDDISTALRIAREFNLKPILAQATEGYLARDVIRRAGIPVIVGPTTQRLDAIQTENATLENAALLADVGIPIAFSSGFEGYVPKNHVLLFEAAIAAANGLGWDRTLQPPLWEPPEFWGLPTAWARSNRAKTPTLCFSMATRSSTPHTSRPCW